MRETNGEVEGGDIRLAALRSYDILDTSTEQGFDDLAALAKQICATPVALVTLLDRDRQWFKAHVGTEISETPIGSAICRHAIGHEGVLVIPDLAADPRTAANPLVTEPPHVRFYAGAPLTTPTGIMLGTLCVLDVVPRPEGLSPEQLVTLEALARQVMGQLELRRALSERDAAIRSHEAGNAVALAEAARLEAMIATQQAVAVAEADLRVVFQAIVEGALRVVDAADGAVIELRDGNELVYDTVSGTSTPHRGIRLGMEQTLSGKAVLTERPLYCADTRADDEMDHAQARELGIRSMIVVPVTRRGEPIGALKVQSSRADAFSPRDVVMTQMLAGLVASAFGDVAEVRSQRALREADRRYRQTFESVTEFAIVVTDREGAVTEWNTGAERIFGWTADEMRGSDASRFFTPEDQAGGRARFEMEESLRNGQARDERWHLKKDGSRFYASGNMMPLVGDAGEHLGFIKVVRDRTEQHEAGKALEDSRHELAASEAKWRGLFESLEEGFILGRVLRDEHGRVVDWMYEEVNRAWGELVGIPSQEAAGRTIRQLFPGIEDAWVDEFADVVETGEAIHFTRQVGAIDRWYDGICQPIGDDRFTVIFLEVTQRVKAEETLRATEERYRLASRATNDAIWDWDLIANHVRWNEALETAYGHAPEAVEPTGEWWIGCIHPDDRARINASIHAVIDEGGTAWADEYRFVRVDGTYADVYDRGHVIRDAHGRPLRMIGAMLDLTRVQKAEAELRESQRELLVERGLLQAVIQQAPLGISIAWADGHGEINARLEQMLGHGAGTSGDARYASFHALHEDGRPYTPEEYPTIRALRGGETLINEPMRYRNPRSGEVRRLELSSTPVRDEAGRILAAVTIVIDVEDRLRAEEYQGVLNREISHRLKNSLALVSAIVTQTLRTAPDLLTARRVLTERILTLSNAHDILMAGQGDVASVGEVVRSATRIHDAGGRIEIAGPEVTIGPRASLTLSLICHELSTNALKYGSLSVPEGRVVISWSLESGGSDGVILVFEWQEEDGPLIEPPQRRSFGTRLIEMGLSGTSGGESELLYHPAGVRCRIVAPLKDLQEGQLPSSI